MAWKILFRVSQRGLASPGGGVNLVAGKRYYLEALQKPGGAATQPCVRWRLPNGMEERLIPGARLAPPSADW